MSCSLVKKSEKSCVVDFDGYEAMLRMDGPNTIVFETDDDDEGFQSLAMHMLEFVNSRRRTVGDILAEVVKVFNKYVTEDSSDDDSDDDDDEDGGLEAEYEQYADEEPVKRVKTAAEQVDVKQFNFPSIAKGAATQRLVADFAALKHTNTKEVGFVAEPLDGNLYRWRCKIYPPSDSQLHKDLEKVKRKAKTDCILLEMLFPSEYPNDPPFIRVLKPRFQMRSGHVTIGGSICMDLLTCSGWSPVNSIESVLIQIRTEMVVGGGRLDTSNTREYTVEEAKAAFVRVAGQHGWKVPEMNNLPWH